MPLRALLLVLAAAALHTGWNILVKRAKDKQVFTWWAMSAPTVQAMVHTRARRQGIGQALMTAVDDIARAAGRTLLVLDTRRGDVSEQLYLKQGYTRAGIIPRYAQSANGALDDTAIFYRML
jgi:GNAT superfamily N-acetyltransferase